MTKVEVRVATRQELVEMTGESRLTMKGLAGVVDGRVIAVGGLAFVAGRVLAFCDLTEEARQYPITLWREAKKLLSRADHNFIFAQPDPHVSAAKAWLERLGFEDYDDGVMRWVRQPLL